MKKIPLEGYHVLIAVKDLRDFLQLLESEGELARIDIPLSRDLEIAEVTSRVSKGPKELNKALLFEKVKGSNIPVLTNLFGNEKRMALALRVGSLQELSQRLEALVKVLPPRGFKDLFALGGFLKNILHPFFPKPSFLEKAPCHQIVKVGKEASLEGIPVLRSWPKDGGYFITLPQVVTLDPRTGRRNVGMYRLQVVDEKTLLVHWQRHKDAARHQLEAQRLCLKEIPCAVVLGGDPAAIWAASVPLPYGLDEYLLAAWLKGGPLEMTRCISQPLEVPARSEIVIEGFIDLKDLRPEGPFGDHTGYYTPQELFPTLHITAVTMREEPLYPATVVGIPPMEDYWMGKATERLFLPLIRFVLPEVVDVHMPPEGVFHNLVLVSIKKHYPGQARKVIFGLWGLGLMSLAKAIVVVDDEVDLDNLSEVAWYVLGNVDWKRDVVIVEGPLDQLDHASPEACFGGKIGIDATRKLPEEGHRRPWPEKVSMAPEVKDKIDVLWPEILKALKPS